MIETFLVHRYPFPVDLRTHISNIFIIAVIYSLKNILSVLYIKVDVRKTLLLLLLLFLKKEI